MDLRERAIAAALSMVMLAAVVVVGVEFGEGRALARPRVPRRAALLNVLVLSLESPRGDASATATAAAAASPDGARPDWKLADPALSQYPTPRSLGVVGYAVAMVAMHFASRMPNLTRPFVAPIPLVSSGAVGGALYARFQ